MNKTQIMRKNFRFFSLLCVTFSLLLLSCGKEFGGHYDVPEWLKGSAWEVLESKENYSTFLRGIELSGFRPMVEGKSIITVMAPNDEAFKTYLSTKGYSSIDDMSKDELKKLIGFHLLYYSYNKEKMVNFRIAGDRELEEDKVANAGLYYKFRTRSQNAPTTAVDTLGQEITIYHLERFLPVFSHKFFETKQIDAKSNYEYFYPNSTWTGADGFNASNASVTEYQILADNGYIYAVDRVLEPLETIYDELKNNPNYSEFFNLYDGYTTYVLDDELTTNYKDALGVTALYTHAHGNTLPPIAQEWPVSNQYAIPQLMRDSYNIFAPSNEALAEFYARYWQIGGYSSLADVDRLVMNRLLLQFVHEGTVVFPEEIKKGTVNNIYDIPFNFDPYQTSDKKICINGSFYGLSYFPTPPLFASVIGPVFKYKDYISFCYILAGSGMNPYLSTNTNYVVLMPNNDQMAVNDITLEYINPGDPSRGKDLMRLDEGEMVFVSTSDREDIANVHTSDRIEALNLSGTHVYETKTPFEYWYVKDGKITNSTFFNKMIVPNNSNNDPFVPFHQITSDEGDKWTNGRAYAYDSQDGIFMPTTGSLIYDLATNNDERYPYYEFARLLKMAGLVSGQNIVYFPEGFIGRFVMFIPTNEVIRQAWADGKIPGLENCTNPADWDNAEIVKDVAKLNNYMTSYFISMALNVIPNHPYIGSSFRSGDYRLLNNVGILEYNDTGSSLTVKLKDSPNAPANVAPYFINNLGQQVNTYYFPFVYRNGSFHFIDAML